MGNEYASDEGVMMCTFRGNGMDYTSLLGISMSTPTFVAYVMVDTDPSALRSITPLHSTGCLSCFSFGWAFLDWGCTCRAKVSISTLLHALSASEYKLFLLTLFAFRRSQDTSLLCRGVCPLSSLRLANMYIQTDVWCL
jgi:hypothetical protein